MEAPERDTTVFVRFAREPEIVLTVVASRYDTREKEIVLLVFTRFAFVASTAPERLLTVLTRVASDPEACVYCSSKCSEDPESVERFEESSIYRARGLAIVQRAFCARVSSEVRGWLLL